MYATTIADKRRRHDIQEYAGDNAGIVQPVDDGGSVPSHGGQQAQVGSRKYLQ